MRTLTKTEINQTSGAVTCTLNPNPINLAELGGAIALGAIGGNWPGAILGGGVNYIAQSWNCTWR
ncbi:hypothetical protein [Burkholderia cepacia]|uniref:Bacteriocin n=1 Tax=Burkholderia cepacia TaxID=292 RepID=A0A8I1AY68_BURCE|nr:hypothetical protein [Burkholderia cepacia]MBA9901543.1 hypothetical protein [Burkholderia cepacia]MBA9945082.1 hypothetical protein [Burkholderia cepacia]MBA9975532.1 hypothetical protein [Burkholderia cepacia]MBA9993730.1 hypothetical protein [Burkholderia cepacia]MBB0002027.1 hypothetical protein [Burkholderia cepacia]